MDKQLELFKNEKLKLQVRVIQNDDGSISVNAEDIAIGFGWYQIKNAIKYPKWERINGFLKEFGFSPQVGKDDYIPESIFYLLGMKASNKVAKDFQIWLANDVIPSIRQTGGYIPTDEAESEADILAKAVLIAQKTIKRKDEKIVQLVNENELLEEKIEDDKHKVSFAEAVENSEDLILVKEMATIITQSGFEIGQNQLFEYLRKYEYLCSKKGAMYNLPTKKHEDLFKVTKRNIQHTNGTEVKKTSKINGKGQLYFAKKFTEYKLQGLTIKDLLSKKQEVM